MMCRRDVLSSSSAVATLDSGRPRSRPAKKVLWSGPRESWKNVASREAVGRSATGSRSRHKSTMKKKFLGPRPVITRSDLAMGSSRLPQALILASSSVSKQSHPLRSLKERKRRSTAVEGGCSMRWRKGIPTEAAYSKMLMRRRRGRETQSCASGDERAAWKCTQCTRPLIASSNTSSSRSVMLFKSAKR